MSLLRIIVQMIKVFLRFFKGKKRNLMPSFKKQIFDQTIHHLVILSLLLKGCATPNQSAGLNGGAIAGGLSDPKKDGNYRTRNVVIGQTKGIGTPLLKDPRVEARWVDSKVTGSRYVEGHFEYQIIEPAQWESRQ